LGVRDAAEKGGGPRNRIRNSHCEGKWGKGLWRLTLQVREG